MILHITNIRVEVCHHGRVHSGFVSRFLPDRSAVTFDLETYPVPVAHNPPDTTCKLLPSYGVRWWMGSDWELQPYRTKDEAVKEAAGMTAQYPERNAQAVLIDPDAIGAKI